MSRKAAIQQPDLLGEPHETEAPTTNAIARRDPKGSNVVKGPAPVNMLAVIAKAAADPNVNPDKMRALLDLQKEIMAEEARISFTAAFIEMQAELPTITADGRIVIEGKPGKRGQNTPYAKFSTINSVVKPILKKHGFSLSFSAAPSPDGTRLNVLGYLDHVRGHQRSTTFPLPAETSGSKNNVQGWGSTFSYGKRYAAIALLNIVSEAKEDADTDGRSFKEMDDASATISNAQKTKLEKAIEFCGVGLDKFCHHYNITATTELPAAMFNEAMKACQDFADKRVSK